MKNLAYKTSNGNNEIKVTGYFHELLGVVRIENGMYIAYTANIKEGYPTAYSLVTIERNENEAIAQVVKNATRHEVYSKINN